MCVSKDKTYGEVGNRKGVGEYKKFLNGGRVSTKGVILSSKMLVSRKSQCSNKRKQ